MTRWCSECFGGLTPEKRIPQVLAAFAGDRCRMPRRRGCCSPARRPRTTTCTPTSPRAASADRVIVTGYLETDDGSHRSPRGLRRQPQPALADRRRNVRRLAARARAPASPTVITDLAHSATSFAGSADVDVDVRGRDREDAKPPASTPPSSLDPASDLICVAIDILDEDHSLRLAMRRLAQDAELRERLGRAGQAWWQREHSLEAMVEDYERVVLEVLKVPAPECRCQVQRQQCTAGTHARRMEARSCARSWGLSASRAASKESKGVDDHAQRRPVRDRRPDRLGPARAPRHRPRRVAVERNFVVDQTRRVCATPIETGDQIEIVNFVGGGIRSGFQELLIGILEDVEIRGSGNLSYGSVSSSRGASSARG